MDRSERCSTDLHDTKTDLKPRNRFRDHDSQGIGSHCGVFRDLLLLNDRVDVNGFDRLNPAQPVASRIKEDANAPMEAYSGGR